VLPRVLSVSALGTLGTRGNTKEGTCTGIGTGIGTGLINKFGFTV
jgi:hypothetical protein